LSIYTGETSTIGGVFVVLLCGLAMAIVVAILEFCWNSKRNAQQEKVYNAQSTAIYNS
jgi:MFS superfamily sulfate permease-like transporter